MPEKEYFLPFVEDAVQKGQSAQDGYSKDSAFEDDFYIRAYNGLQQQQMLNNT